MKMEESCWFQYSLQFQHVAFFEYLNFRLSRITCEVCSAVI